MRIVRMMQIPIASIANHISAAAIYRRSIRALTSIHLRDGKLKEEASYRLVFADLSLSVAESGMRYIDFKNVIKL
jgi:hypothetical protein